MKSWELHSAVPLQEWSDEGFVQRCACGWESPPAKDANGARVAHLRHVHDVCYPKALGV